MDGTARASLLRLASEFGGPEQHPLAHDLSGFELHGSSGRNDHVLFGLLRIAADAGSGQANLEYSKVPQFHIATGGQGIGDGVKRVLEDREHLCLDHSGILLHRWNRKRF